MAYEQRGERDYGGGAGGGAQVYEGGGFGRGRGRSMFDYALLALYWQRKHA